MKLEIEVHEARISNSIVELSYTIYEGETTADVPKHQIKKSTLISFINEEGLNQYCSDVILGQYNEFSAEVYLEENLSEVVKSYLEIEYLREAA